MSAFVFYEDAESIVRAFSDPDVESDIVKLKRLLRKSLQVTSDKGCLKLFPFVVKFLASSDILVKKLASWFVVKNADHEQLVLLAVNTLVKDCTDPSPAIRGLAIKSLCSLGKSFTFEMADKAVTAGLQDRSSYVRRAAVTGCLRLHHMDNQYLHDSGIIDQLYGMIRDQDPIVVVNCLQVLDDVLSQEGGVVINRNMSIHLLNKLQTLTDWGLVLVLQLLTKYRPKSEEEILNVLNIVDRYLKHSNAAVVVNAFQYFLHLIRDMPHLRGEVFQRVKPRVVHFLGAGNAELAYELIEFIEPFLKEDENLFSSHFRSFFCRHTDPTYLKLTKIQLIPMFISDENIEEIIEELSIQCSDVDTEVSSRAVKALGKILGQDPSHYDKCMSKLLQLLTTGVDYVTVHVLKVLVSLDFKDDETTKQVMREIPKCIDLVTDEEGRAAILWLLGTYGEYLVESPYMLEEFIESAAEEPSEAVLLQTLTAAVKLFLKRPAECQELLGQLFETTLNSSTISVKDRALFLFSLLQSNVDTACITVLRKEIGDISYSLEN